MTLQTALCRTSPETPIVDFPMPLRRPNIISLTSLSAKIQDMLKKESPKPVKDEVRLQVYTAVVNVDNVEKGLDELIMEAATE